MMAEHLLLWPQNQSPHVGPILTSIKKSVSSRAIAWVTSHAPDRLETMADVAPDGQITHRFWRRGVGYDRNVWADDAIWNTTDYIHLNPVRRGLCPTAIDWEWSSARHHANLAPSIITLDLDTLPPKPSNT